MKNDKYSHARGGWSRILDVSCEKCSEHVCYYQKDGPGPLKRMCLDRMLDITPTEKEFECNNCKQVLGMKINYEKENRPAYRLFQNSVTKKIIQQSTIKF